MANHVHLVAVPQRSDSLARALGRTHAEYACYLNARRLSCGHLWQARFFSCPLSGNHIWNAMAYVERNPVRAGVSVDAIDYRWSTARAHAIEDDLSGFLDLRDWRSRYSGRDWHEFLNASVEDSDVAEQLRTATQRGRPFADDESILHFERRLGRRLRARPTGRRGTQELASDGVLAGAV